MEKKRIFLGLASLLLVAKNANAQVAEALQEQQSQIASIAEIIVNMVLAIFGVVALIQAIMVFIGSGTGEDKIKRSGTYIFMLVFVAVGYFLSKRLFN